MNESAVGFFLTHLESKVLIKELRNSLVIINRKP